MITLALAALLALLPLWTGESWPPGPAQTQPAEECVGYAWAHYLGAAPAPQGALSGHTVYQWWQVDHPGEWPLMHRAGESLQARGYIHSQQWSQRYADALTWITRGPVLMAGRRGTYDHAWICYRRNPSSDLWSCQDSLSPHYWTVRGSQLVADGVWYGTAQKGP